MVGLFAKYEQLTATHTLWQRNNRKNSNKKSKKICDMRNNLYICNAKQPTMVNNTYEYRNLRILLCSSVNSLGCLATISKGVRSLFVQRKLVTQMPNNNKQAMNAKHSNLSQFLKTSIIGTVAFGGLILFIGGTSPIYNILGIVLIAVAGILNKRWDDGNDYSQWANEFVSDEE